MAKNYFNRYVWLLDTLMQHEGYGMGDLKVSIMTKVPSGKRKNELYL